MNLFRILFELFVLYLVYKLIFDFIIPVFQTTKQMKVKMGEMQQKMNEQAREQQAKTFQSAEKEVTPKAKREDYIEFEEVK